MPGPTSIHPPAQQREMLATIGVKSIRELVDAGVMPLDSVAPAVSEPELEGLLRERARLDGTYKNFIAAGVGERHIPAAVWQLALSGSHELTPVFGFTDQAQGALRLQYELQTMLSHLCGLDLISTAYSDGARALAQAITIACAVRTRPWRAVLPTSVNPAYRRVVRSLLALHDIELVEVPFCSNRGDTPVARIGDSVTDATVLVIAQPNYFGIWEDTDTLTDYAREHDWLVIALVDPFALALVKPPGAWGRHGADLAVGSGQPLGLPAASGGPYFGFMCAKRSWLGHLGAAMAEQLITEAGRVVYRRAQGACSAVGIAARFARPHWRSPDTYVYSVPTVCGRSRRACTGTPRPWWPRLPTSTV